MIDPILAEGNRCHVGLRRIQPRVMRLSL